MRQLSIPGTAYQCAPKRIGAIRSWRRDTRPSRLPRWVPSLLKVLL